MVSTPARRLILVSDSSSGAPPVQKIGCVAWWALLSNVLFQTLFRKELRLHVCYKNTHVNSYFSRLSGIKFLRKNLLRALLQVFNCKMLQSHAWGGLNGRGKKKWNFPEGRASTGRKPPSLERRTKLSKRMYIVKNPLVLRYREDYSFNRKRYRDCFTQHTIFHPILFDPCSFLVAFVKRP